MKKIIINKENNDNNIIKEKKAEGDVKEKAAFKTICTMQRQAKTAKALRAEASQRTSLLQSGTLRAGAMHLRHLWRAVGISAWRCAKKVFFRSRSYGLAPENFFFREMTYGKNAKKLFVRSKSCGHDAQNLFFRTGTCGNRDKMVFFRSRTCGRGAEKDIFGGWTCGKGGKLTIYDDLNYKY